MADEILHQYDQLLTWFIESKVRSDNADWSMLEKFGREGLVRIASFQRFLERKKEELKIFNASPYFARTLGDFEEIIVKIRTEKNIYADPYRSYQGIYREMSKFLESVGERERYPLQSCYEAILTILKSKILPDIVDLCEDVKLVREMMLLPLEERRKILNDLKSLEFDQVAEHLEDAQAHLFANPVRPRETLSCARLGLEKLIDDILAKSGQPLKHRFGQDLDSLEKVKPHIVDRGLKRLVQGVFDYLSIQGSHPYTEKETEPAELGLNQTYEVISEILRKIHSQND